MAGQKADQTGLSILLVEDNPADAFLVREVLEESGILGELIITNDGEEVFDYLNTEIMHHKDGLPDLILLDLNIPKKDGFSVLHDIKTNPQLQSIPVIILTTSQDSSDMQKAAELHADCYLVKPFDLNKCGQIADLLKTK